MRRGSLYSAEAVGMVTIYMMPDWNGVSEEEFPESVVDEMVDDDYGPDNRYEEDLANDDQIVQHLIDIKGKLFA